MKPFRVILSGGGTGGHIFPAIAIANAIKALKPETEFLFVGAKGRMEMEKVPSAGYQIEGLDIAGFQRRLTIANFLFPIKVVKSLIRANQILKKFKPDLVIGTGGYASGPLLYMASLKNIPALIQEQNSFPGITNKLLGTRVNKICVAFAGMDNYFPKNKIVITGNPIRSDINSHPSKIKEGIEFFKLDPTKITLLIIGGSLGARTINESIHAGLSKLVSKQIQVIWQTGNAYSAKVTAIQAEYSTKGVIILPFITRIDLAYAVADIVVSRAGAISISELQVAGKAAILVPSPNVTDDHQTKNAMALVQNEAAIIVKDNQAASQLVNQIEQLVENEAQRNKLKINIEKMAMPLAAQTIAEHALNIINAH